MKAAVIGLGGMGCPMAINLHQAGMLGAAWNRSADRATTFTEACGINTVDSLQQAAESCDVIITSVSADIDLFEVIDALKPHLRPGTVIIDTSTVSRGTARRIYGELKSIDIDFLDAPVSGGVEGAKNGKLSIMVGGEEAVLEKVRPVLEVIGERIVYMGAAGNGQATKAVNQVMAAGINQAVTEAMAFGQALDLPMDKVIEIVGSGAAGNWFVNHRGLSMLAGQFDPGFRVALHNKDLGICLTMAESTRVNLSLTEQTRDQYTTLMGNGYGDEDISALFRLKV